MIWETCAIDIPAIYIRVSERKVYFNISVSSINLFNSRVPYVIFLMIYNNDMLFGFLNRWRIQIIIKKLIYKIWCLNLNKKK
jgi:hypothetical protein